MNPPYQQQPNYMGYPIPPSQQPIPQPQHQQLPPQHTFKTDHPYMAAALQAGIPALALAAYGMSHKGSMTPGNVLGGLVGVGGLGAAAAIHNKNMQKQLQKNPPGQPPPMPGQPQQLPPMPVYQPPAPPPMNTNGLPPIPQQTPQGQPNPLASFSSYTQVPGG